MPVLPYAVPLYALAESTNKHTRDAVTKANANDFFTVLVFFTVVSSDFNIF